MKLGETKAVVEAVTAGEKDGAPTVTVSVRYEDGRSESSELRADLAPAGLAAGDEVLVTKAALYGRWTIKKA